MVLKHSATHSGPDERLCNRIPVRSNHRNLVKFSGESNATYIIVQNLLEDMVLKAPGVIERRYEVKRASPEGIFEVL